MTTLFTPALDDMIEKIASMDAAALRNFELTAAALYIGGQAARERIAEAIEYRRQELGRPWV
jgi:hypothetical protein